MDAAIVLRHALADHEVSKLVVDEILRYIRPLERDKEHGESSKRHNYKNGLEIGKRCIGELPVEGLFINHVCCAQVIVMLAVYQPHHVLNEEMEHEILGLEIQYTVEAKPCVLVLIRRSEALGEFLYELLKFTQSFFIDADFSKTAAHIDYF